MSDPPPLQVTEQNAMQILQLEIRYELPIIRLFAIICTRSEPIAGWIDNYYGPAGYIASVETGLIRVGRADSTATAEFVPADMCINVVAGHYTGKSGTVGEPKIFNFTSSSQNRLTYGNFTEYFLEAGKEVPSNEAIWFPQLIPCKSRFLYHVLSLIYHILPACIMDVILVVLLKRPKVLGTSLKLERFVSALSYFACRTWTFSNDNLTSMWKELNPRDKVLFAFDMSCVDWKELMRINVRGVRKYLLKQNEQSIPSAIRRMFWLGVINKATQVTIILPIIYFVSIFLFS